MLYVTYRYLWRTQGEDWSRTMEKKSSDMTPQERMAALDYALELAERMSQASCESPENSVEIVALRPAVRATDESSY